MIKVDNSSSEEVEKTSRTGLELLNDPLYNKGTAFTIEEREELGLLGLLPPHIDNIDGQIDRAYQAFCMEPTDLEKHIFLRNLQDHNEVLFYRLLMDNIAEMMPIIYTPTVGEACQKFSHIFRQRRGLYISYPHRHQIRQILDNTSRSEVRVIVVTDGERILGLGDQGTDGMGIPIGKLSLYSLCGGINPATTLPVILDAGCDNEERLKDPLYIGWRNKRIRDERYDEFIEDFVRNVSKKFPGVLLQWEDFANQNARRLLEKYKERLLTFNDDIKGTAAVALAAIMSALKVIKEPEGKQNYVIFGAGSAGVGVAELLVEAMVDEGLSVESARDRIWLVDRYGLIHSQYPGEVQAVQKPFMKDFELLKGSWQFDSKEIGLRDVVKNARATVLIGTSAQKGAFSQAVISEMMANSDRPIVFPLSNPNACSEAHPADILSWTDGKALVSTGSPFGYVDVNGKRINIGQCNNCYIFPGVGLGAIISRASRITDSMFMKAARALSELTPAMKEEGASLLPPLTEIRQVSQAVAYEVAKEAVKCGVAAPDFEAHPPDAIEKKMWIPRYRKYVKTDSLD